MHKNVTRRSMTPLAVLIACAAATLVATIAASAQDYPSIPYRQAEDHLDEIVWVEGTILRTEKAAEGTYLLFSANEKYVRILIPAANLGAFDGSLSHKYTGKKIKAVGKVAKYGYKLIVGINEPKRIRFVDQES